MFKYWSTIHSHWVVCQNFHFLEVIHHQKSCAPGLQNRNLRGPPKPPFWRVKSPQLQTLEEKSKQMVFEIEILTLLITNGLRDRDTLFAHSYWFGLCLEKVKRSNNIPIFEGYCYWMQTTCTLIRYSFYGFSIEFFIALEMQRILPYF